VAQGFPFFEIAQMRHFSKEYAGGAFAVGGPTDHVKEVGGREPEQFESIARRYIADPALIHPTIRIGTKTQALAFMIRMMLARVPDLDAWERSQGHAILNTPVLCHESDAWRAAAEKQQALLSQPDMADSSAVFQRAP
jgi:hypothetical protein